MIGSDGKASQSFLRTASLTWRSAPPRDCLPTRPWTGPLSAQRRGTLRQVQAALASQRNGVLSTHIRCRMIARRRATATVAFAIPRRRATETPHAFSGELRFEIRTRIPAASTNAHRIPVSPHFEIPLSWSISPDCRGSSRRSRAIDLTTRRIDAAREMGVHLMTVWPGRVRSRRCLEPARP